MRFLISFSLLSIAALQSCSEKKEPPPEVKHQTIQLSANAGNFELLMFDTINKTDIKGLKQGKWIIRKLPGHIVIESGNYKDNLKEGYWLRNNLKGEFIDSIYYEADIPRK